MGQNTGIQPVGNNRAREKDDKDGGTAFQFQVNGVNGVLHFSHQMTMKQQYVLSRGVFGACI